MILQIHIICVYDRSIEILVWMNVFVCVYIYMDIYIYIHILHIYIYIHIHLHLIYIYMCVYVFTEDIYVCVSYIYKIQLYT